LRQQVVQGLEKRWSPEQISAHLAREATDATSMRACTETIYEAIYRDGPDALRRNGAAPTRTRRTRRQPRRDPERRRPRFVEPMRLIAQRPAEVEQRTTIGHWEGDLIVGTLHRSAIATIVDRATRYLMLVHLGVDHTADRVRDRLIESMSPLPAPLRRTLTWDQGAEMSGHGEIRAATGIDIYFCDPASPWQRGTNENTNGLLREYFPKGTDLSQHSRQRLAEVADELNARPRKILNWDTPAERLRAHLASA
jgi:IS30 family transposase